MKPQTTLATAAAAAAGVVEVEKMITDSETLRSVERARWEAQTIYRVPEWIKDMSNRRAYQPQVVSLGPIHHGESRLKPMEEHKRRAVAHLVKRSGAPLRAFVAKVEEAAEQLQAAYGPDLGDEWRAGDGDDEAKNKEKKDRFVAMMVTDGCFLLEMMNMELRDYQQCDPVFSRYGKNYLCPTIGGADMLLIENQVPLLLLQRLVTVQRGGELVSGTDINKMLLKFLGKHLEDNVIDNMPLGHHPLDIYHTSLLYYNSGAQDAWVWQEDDEDGLDMMPSATRIHEEDDEDGLDIMPLATRIHEEDNEDGLDMMPSATRIHEAGIKIRTSETSTLRDIHFEHGVLRMPVLEVDDNTECVYLNLMAFERLHVRAGALVTAYVIFMDSMIDSAKDVTLLGSKGVILNLVGSDKEVAKLFTGSLSKGAVVDPSPEIHKGQSDIKAYCKRRRNRW